MSQQQTMPWGAKHGDRLLSVRAALAAEGVTADPLQLIAELDQ